MSNEPITFSEELEQKIDHEDSVIAETIDLMRKTMEKAFDKHRHAASGTHSKSHGALTGRLHIYPDLPAELAQGMFAEPADYEVVLRLASEPGQIDPDQAKRARGAALKVLDVPGEKLKDGWTSQDWLFNTWPVIPEGDAGTYLIAIQEREKHEFHHVATTAATLARVRDKQALLFDSTPNIHPLAHTYYTQSAFRYGKHIAKLRIRPAEEQAAELGGKSVSHQDPSDVLSRWVRDYTAHHETRFTLEVQLLTDTETMPIEDASVQWPEEKSPYRPVADLVFGAQESFSPARRVYVDDVLGGRPWYGLVAHRPLGSINRVRKPAYDQLGQWRYRMNAVEPTEPQNLSEVPD